MTKKHLSKLLSVILTLSICLTAVLGCLVTVNAQDAPSYVVTGAQCEVGQLNATATVEFTVSEGIAAVSFSVNNDTNWYSSVEATALVDDTDNAEITVDNGYFLVQVYDAAGVPKEYTTLGLELDFVFANGGIQDNISIAVENVEAQGEYADEYYDTFVNNSENAVFSVGCQHQYEVSGDAVYESNELGYTLYSVAKCKLCGETKNEYQIVPEVGDGNDGEVVIFSGAASSAKPVELLDATAPNSESNPYIIELPVQLLALSRGVLKNTAGEEVSAGGYYYKVKDGIKAFVMQGVDAATASTVMSLSSADAVSEYFANAATKTTYWGLLDGNKTFNGHFDGNGVEIYGLYSPNQAAALFTQVSGTSSIKNLSVKNSYIAASSGAGVAAIVGKTPNDTNVDSVVIENIVVANNYIEQTGNQVVGANAIVGMANSNTNSSSADQRDAVKIYDCLVYGNELVNDAYTGTALKSGLVGDCTGRFEMKNVISLGTTPWTLNAGGWYLKQINDGTIKNIYTDASQADWDAYAAYHANNTPANAKKHNINYALDVNSLKGDAAKTTASVLNWNTDENPDGIWFTNANQYPSLLKANKLAVADATDHAWKLVGVNVSYGDDGSFDLNFHFDLPYDSDVALYVANSKSESKSQIITEYETSPFAGVTLSANAKRFTVSNLSAKELDTLWVASVVAKSKDNSTIVYGESKQISVSEYAEKIVIGEAIYDESTPEDQKAADKTVAAALINYSQAANDALSSTAADSSNKIVEKWDGRNEKGAWIGYQYATFSGGTGTKDDPYIIKYSEQLAYLTTASAATYDATVGKYYKVDDSIKAFDMNTSGLDLSGDMTAQEVYDLLNDEVVGRVYWSMSKFAGNFDGNGVEIYGLHTGHMNYVEGGVDKTTEQVAALFPKVTAGAVIKNVTIKNSYMYTESTTAYAGGIIGGVYNDAATAGSTADTVYIENCVVHDCYVGSKNTSAAPGILVGYAADVAFLNISNTLVYGNEVANAKNTTKSIVGNASKWVYVDEAQTTKGTNNRVINSVILDAAPYDANGSWWFKACDQKIFQNVYFDNTTATSGFGNYGNANSKLTQLASADAAKGSAAKVNMPDLDWETIWMYGAAGEYPSIVLTDAKVNPVSVYSGTPDTSVLEGFGTEESPYIIKTADQFAAVALGKVKYAQGSYFKVDPSVKYFYMNGGATVAAMTNVADVEAYFEANGGYGWTSSWNNANANEAFSGHFDGSGVTIYGLYDVNDGNTGLFEMAEDNSSFKNFALKNSYISVTSGAGAAALVGKVSKQSDPDIMTFENVIVANNHIEQKHTTSNVGASVILGYIYNNTDGISVNKCLIYGNNIVNANASGATYGLVSTGGSGSASLYRFRNVVALGVKPYTAGVGYYLRVLDANECFVNVYTDQDCSAMANYNATNKEKYNFNDNADISILKGANAPAALGDEFEWDSVWFAGNFSDYPSFTPASSLPSNVQSQYNTVTFTESDNVGYAVYIENGTMGFGVYQTALSLKANPYMTFAFAFHGEYKENRENIKIKFTYTQNGQTVTSNEIAVPKYVEGQDIVNVNGWTNTAKNGRYHTYKAENIPVEALVSGIKVEASYNNGEWVDLGTYSASGLGQQFEQLNRENPCKYYETRVEAVKALLFYVQAINARYGSK